MNRLVIYRCSRCGIALDWIDEKSKTRFTGLMPWSRIANLLGGSCPYCGRKLEFKGITIADRRVGEEIIESTKKALKIAVGDGTKQRVVSIKLPESVVDVMKYLVESGRYASISEVVREAVRELALRKG